jgi:tetratricopeptide (TPR) repeat protein
MATRLLSGSGCLLALLFSACSYQGYAVPKEQEAILHKSEQLEADRQFDAAIALIESTLPFVPKEYVTILRVRNCTLLERKGEHSAARDCYLKEATSDDAEWAPLSAYYAAEILNRTNPWAAFDELDLLMLAHPNSDAASRALHLAQGIQRTTRGNTAERDYLHGLAARLWVTHRDAADGGDKARSLISQSFVEAARIEIQAELNKQAADSLARAVLFGRGTTWLDDALIELARHHRQQKNLEGALESYGMLVEAQESSWIVGSYYSTYYGEALYEMGQVLESLGREGEALDAYGEVRCELEESRWEDDAEYASALIHFKRGDRSPMEDFIEDYPDSRLLKDAKEMLK